MTRLAKILPVILILIAALPAIWPLLQPGFFVTDDGNWMIIRLAAFHQTLRSGQFPVRFLYSLNHGFGYPVTNFLYPLPFYLGEIIHLIGFNFTDSIKALFALSFPLSALGMYLLVKTEWGKWPAMISALFYIYAPYRIFDVYSRGSLGEALAFVFIPFVFYFLRRQALVPAAISFAALITGHNVIAFIFAPFILLFALRQKQIVSTILFCILSLSLSAFFWLPALYDLQFTRAGITQVANFNQYFLNRGNSVSLVGIVIPFIAATSLFLLRKKQNRLFYICLIATFVSLFLASFLSQIFWQNTILPKVIQFPWRFLSLTVFGSSVLLGIAISKLRPLLIIIVAIIILGLSFSSLKVNRTFFPDSFYATNDDTTTVKNEYMSKWVRTDPKNKVDSYMEVLSGKANIPTKNSIEALTPSVIRINQIYFPGWKVLVDGRETIIDYKANGFLEFAILPGNHTIKAIFTETPVRKFANGLSLTAIIVILASPLARRNKRQIAPKK